jgi:hypothetical protein
VNGDTSRVVNVKTPTIDEVIIWAQEELHRAHLVGSELHRSDAKELAIPQNSGLLVSSDLIDSYRGVPSPSAEMLGLDARPA